jgi:flagellar motor switch protein FliM
MAVNDLLSQEEINALLHDSSEDLITTDGDNSSDSLSENKEKIAKGDQ